jgi:hypothetical protein
VGKDGIDRRRVLAGAAAVAVAACVPLPAAAREEFVALHAALMEACKAFEEAREASFLARPRIMEEVRRTSIRAFFAAPEIKTRSRTRGMAQAAAQRLFTAVAENDAEAAMQEEALTIYVDDLGGSPASRERFSTTFRDERS